MTLTEHLTHGRWIGKQSGIGIGIGNGIKVGRIQVKFDNVPLVKVVNKVDDAIGSAGGGGGGRGGGGGGINGYWKRLISTGDGQGMVDGKRSEGCQVRLTGRLEVDWSIRRIFPFEWEDEDEDDDDRWRFDEGEGVFFRVSPLDFILEIIGVWRRIGNNIFRRFVSMDCCSYLLVPFFFSED